MIENFDAYLDMLEPLSEEELFGEDKEEDSYYENEWLD